MLLSSPSGSPEAVLMTFDSSTTTQNSDGYFYILPTDPYTLYSYSGCTDAVGNGDSSLEFGPICSFE